jgi:hypothetical protein
MKYVLKPVLRRSLRFGHVLTVWEKEHYAARYDMPVDRFVCVPWFLRWEKDIFPAGSDRRDSSVVSSGRVACDWETLFRAARDRNWNLTVICSRYDLARVEALGCFQNVRILSEISREEHQRYVENAAIYVLCLQEEEMSSGQVRLMDAVRGGTPVVATRVKGLEGYIAHEETGILVNPGDHVALRNAIDRLLGNEDYRCRLARNAFDAAGKRTREHYLHHLQAHVAASIDGRG